MMARQNSLAYANNPEIKEGMTREEIDRAIAKYADTETLFDQPYQDSRRIRVTGPFTVESLSPHRALVGPISEWDQSEKTEGRTEPGDGPVRTEFGPTIDRFVPMIIENLKKTGAGNLFMVFGEPDIDIREDDDGNLVVEVFGVDVCDPTTGQIRSDSTDDIACWFIDTDYNDESFFVRHAYFTGAGEPYDKLKRALKAEIDEVAWATLYRTVSRPFPKPATGKIAVKVINHYGDEVLKVYDVA